MASIKGGEGRKTCKRGQTKNEEHCPCDKMKATESADLKARFGMMKEAAFVHWADSETPCPKGCQDWKKVTCQSKSLSPN